MKKLQSMKKKQINRCCYIYKRKGIQIPVELYTFFSKQKINTGILKRIRVYNLNVLFLPCVFEL